ncbi:hypothetical protein PRIPAC_76192 [Pristionchus pacificus]|uniref:Uncharacterized protein n=1 Tax=Pristionchus pacificus TaxID=54126 RepID=A0A2A6BWV5_PRIPA|nr:hypothetical protein PRIPAC_76192 [Pristionchus pacificus]|eukprot:PDM70241.1 hypothetical protein PRIPAC_45545 [Pristionchus pacificus]
MKYRLLLFALLTGCAAQEIYMMSSEWSRWSPWSFCSGSVRVRVRACATVRGFKCIGHNKEFQSCDLATTTSSPSEGKIIDDPFLEDRSAAMKQLYPDYDQPFKPQAVKVSTTEAPFFKNNQLLERLRENDSLASLINRAATVSPSPSSPSPSSSSSSPPILNPSQEEYEDEEDIEEETPITLSPPSSFSTVSLSTRIPEIRVATVTTKPSSSRVTSQLQRKRPIDIPSTTVSPKKEKEGLESLEHYEDGEIEEGSEYEEPSEGDDGGEKREKDVKSMERNKIVAAASKIITEKERVRNAEDEKDINRRREDVKRENVRHKVDGGDDDLPLSSSIMKRKDLQSQSSQINHIPVKMSTSDPFEDNGIHSKLLNVEVEMRDADKKSRRDLEFTLKNVNGIIEKLEYEARFRATQGNGLTPLQHAYLKRSKDIRSQLIGLMEKKNTTTPSPITTTTTITTSITPPSSPSSTSSPSTPPEPLNPKIAEDTVRALDWLMENINDRLEPEGITVTAPLTTHRPKKSMFMIINKVNELKIVRHRTRRPSYMKGVRFIENGEEIHPHPIRLRTHSIPSQKSFRLPSSSIRTFGIDSIDGKTDDKVKEHIPLLTPTQPVIISSTVRPRPITVLPGFGIEPIIGTDWQPFEWSEWSDWSECVCKWQLRKRICIPHSEEVQCPSPEYQRRKCEGGSCNQRAALH